MKGIIIFGTMGAGKDTLAGMLAEKINGGYIVKLGRGIRGIVDTAAKYDSTIAESRRKYYQAYGQSTRESISEDIWNYVLYDELSSIVEPKNIVPIIADARQVNEWKFWHSKGFYTVGITAPMELRKRRLLKRDGYLPDQKAFTHETEFQAANVSAYKADRLIVNDGTLEYLEEGARIIAEKYGR